MQTVSRSLVFALIASATALGLAGTDLVLPAIPALPGILGGTEEGAQFVLASFTGGAAVGLLLFGEIGGRLDVRRVLVASLLLYAAVSLACAFSSSLPMLIGLRFVQGVAGAAAAVFAPGILRALYADEGAVSAFGLLGSIESLTPALAPIAGLWLLNAFGWTASFDAIAIGAGLCAAALLVYGSRLPAVSPPQATGGYLRLFGNREYMRQSLSHAFTLGALLVIVFGAPTVFVASIGASLEDFIVMQVCGVTVFIVAANVTGRLVKHYGAARLILGGTIAAAVGAVAILVYALAGGDDPLAVTALFLLVNGGLGLRGPPGFHAAIVAAQDDSRGSALLVLTILSTTSLATAAVAPFIGAGLVAIATGGALLAVAASIILLVKPAEKPGAQAAPR